ncbi:class I SAM-dependent methyltransferase [Saccharibacillus sacchari]|uniref:class I SAM-dependent methyltransferase n=1 Tax=Saccharibacillus sacchari TaxID=456493 RepID=UPI0004AE6E3D|nr:class I SAM-dependent methyltransferase [Saccharibacillus sacchari]
MKDTLIFGASKLGSAVLMLCGGAYNVVGFLDNDQNKKGTFLSELPIYQIEDITLQDYHIIIASSYFEEIQEQLHGLGYYSYEVFSYGVSMLGNQNSLVKNEGKLKKISVGALLHDLPKISIEDLSFVGGGSTALDYFLLKGLAQKIGAGLYLEIGTWTGESIAAVSEVVNHCISISLADEHLTADFKNRLEKDNFSRYFSKKANITHYKGDSQTFDFSALDIPDLIFIDGDHSFEGIRKDTKNVFDFVGYENTVVVWHDYRTMRNEIINSTHKAVQSVLSKKYQDRLYLVENTMCGLYLPEKYAFLAQHTELEKQMYSYRVELFSKLNEL